MGDPNASIPTPQPVRYRPMFGAFGRARAATAVTFVSKAALAQDVPRRLGLARRVVAVGMCRAIGKRDMIHNDALPRIEVDPETYAVRADGEQRTCEAARDVQGERRLRDERDGGGGARGGRKSVEAGKGGERGGGRS